MAIGPFGMWHSPGNDDETVVMISNVTFFIAVRVARSTQVLPQSGVIS